MDGGDRDAAGEQLRHHRIDLALGQHEVAHDHRAAIHALEGKPATERERRLDRDAVEGDVQVAARQCVFVHVPRLVGARFAERLIHLAPLHVGGQRRASREK